MDDRPAFSVAVVHFSLACLCLASRLIGLPITNKLPFSLNRYNYLSIAAITIVPICGTNENAANEAFKRLYNFTLEPPKSKVLSRFMLLDANFATLNQIAAHHRHFFS